MKDVFITIITTTVEPIGDKGVNYTELVNLYTRGIHRKSLKFKITINGNSDTEKCNAEVFIWASNTWKSVHKIPSVMIHTSEDVREIFDNGNSLLSDIYKVFKEDRDNLIDVVSNICFD